MRTLRRFSALAALACIGLMGCDSGGDLKEGMPTNVDTSKNYMDATKGAAAGPFSSDMMKAGASAGSAAAKTKGAGAMPGMPGMPGGGSAPIPK